MGYPVTAEGVGAGRGIAVVLTWIADLAITFAPAFARVVMFHEPALRRAWHVKRWVPLMVVMMFMTTNRKVMGQFTLSPLLHVAGWLEGFAGQTRGLARHALDPRDQEG